MTSAQSPVAPPASRRLTRIREGRLVAGVCTGLAEHLGISVWVVRLMFVLLALVHFAGLIGYACLWVAVPLESDRGQPEDAPSPTAHRRASAAVVVLGLLVLALLVGRVGAGRLFDSLTVPVLIVAAGVAVLWRVADDGQRSRWRATAEATAISRGRHSWPRLLGGGVLIAVGVAALLTLRNGAVAAIYGLIALLVVGLGTAAIATPWLLRMQGEIRSERLERIRSEERAEIAAHVHDSVLQTLTLVQRHANEPREVIRLARAEERSLRGWLYAPEDATEGALAAALERAAGEVEAQFGVPIDVVVVGDEPIDARLTATLQAAREAMINASKYAGDEPISVYAEISDSTAHVFVRDRGAGFDVDAIAPDRHGVRESIVGRMERNGGRATIRSATATQAGTEIELVMPIGPA